MLYLWVKALHVVFVIAWMAGLMMAPRLRVYQLSDAPGGKLFEEMKTASARLKTIILTPAMIAVWVLGFSLVALQPSWLQGQGWLHAKILLVFLLSGLHGYISVLGRKVDEADGTVSTKRLRVLNEVPFLVMIAIVILVIVKPF